MAFLESRLHDSQHFWDGRAAERIMRILALALWLALRPAQSPQQMAPSKYPLLERSHNAKRSRLASRSSLRVLI
jgi:hypothetical protein